MPVLLRLAAAQDLPVISRLLELAYRQTYGPLFSPAFWAAHPPHEPLRDWGHVLRDVAGARSVLAVDGEDAVGFARSVPARDGEAGTAPSVRDRELQLLYVLEAQHGSGLGRRLVDAVLGAGAPAELWVMALNTRAQRFYRHLGFSADGVQVHHPEVEAVGGPSPEAVELRMVR